MTGQHWSTGELLTDAKHIGLFPSGPFSDPSAGCLFLHYLFQEYQHVSDTQNKAFLASISWSPARKFPWSIKCSFLLRVELVAKVANKIFCSPLACIFPLTRSVGTQVYICSGFIGNTSLSQLYVASYSFLATGWSCPTNAGGQEFLFPGNAERLQKPYTSAYPESWRFSIYFEFAVSCFGWTRDLLSPFFPFLILCLSLSSTYSWNFYFTFPWKLLRTFPFQN